MTVLSCTYFARGAGGGVVAASGKGLHRWDMGWDEGQGDAFERFPFRAPIRLSTGQMVAPHVVTEELGKLISEERKERFRQVVVERTYNVVPVMEGETRPPSFSSPLSLSSLRVRRALRSRSRPSCTDPPSPLALPCSRFARPGQRGGGVPHGRGAGLRRHAPGARAAHGELQTLAPLLRRRREVVRASPLERLQSVPDHAQICWI